ncbi:MULTISPECIES: tRNA (adenosine(37)-N6)-threonylcarbamoyltransferase complex dimerization subunit type 1 TsaB [unclassified Pseudoalteromonas]|uniref:tRNA (adenosine(37)-N6)-threonylcarbamoyltransferase complex dimerization subunit type 1 TsaB n=1 Tax=unclassified Pseudoalteromonas TaxID=194690 RepID=UPI000CF72F26|nr:MULTISPECIES: tRNA (adenosine(37)-N6)-threonylcarbamoyltransferase complex dimerization subunit type 1 TsaB [unclassified Pseudoalteromonas]
MSQTILALDASTEALSLALLHQDKLYHFFEVCPQQHSQRILDEIDALLKQANCDIQDVDVIGYCQGPGSFTGVRISVSVAQGLAFATKTPVIGVSSLAMMAQQAISERGASTILAAIDARMGEVYLGAYEEKDGLAQLVGEQQVLEPAAVTSPFSAAVAVGTGWQTYTELAGSLSQVEVDKEITLPDSRYMLPLLASEFAKGNVADAASAQPVYVRDTVTWKKLPGRE